MLVLHQSWQWLKVNLFGYDPNQGSRGENLLGTLLTFVAVVIGWVFFRAQSLSAGLAILAGMLGLNGVSLPDAIVLRFSVFADLLSDHGVVFTPGGGHDFMMTYLWLTALLPIVFMAPNTQQIMCNFQPALTYKSDDAFSRFAWSARPGWAIAMAIVLVCGLLSLAQPSEFLYFQF